LEEEKPLHTKIIVRLLGNIGIQNRILNIHYKR